MASAESGKLPPPSALAIGVCDQIYRDRGSGKRSILGGFSELQASAFPAVHPSLGVYLDLTNGRGKVRVKIRIVDADESRDPIWVAEQDIEFAEPRLIAELDFMVSGLTFPEPGEYRVQAFAGGKFIVERRLLVSQLEAQE